MILAVACSDGSVQLMKINYAGPQMSMLMEKKIKAHSCGAVLCIKWDHDGLSFATSGEDGEVKIWSRTGHLRTRLCCFNTPTYGIAWGPNNDKLLSSHDSVLSIHETQGQDKTEQWDTCLQSQGDNGVVLAVDWNRINNLIICGGEDRKYKIYNVQGLCLYASCPQTQVITSLSWSPNGELFAFGSFNMLGLCSQKGWIHSQENINVGSITGISWALDNTNVFAGSGDGSLVIAHVVEKTEEWCGFSANLVGTNQLVVSNCIQSSDQCSEYIDIPR